ncbi:magnesium and cobalt transport protein CorA [Streptomyces xanthophaeus]|uniref:magnesium and cobalt transport protein CorA n=1 Tax=Streptomyces xanthophaeus TaxID=67385 RepID=UPI00386F968F|nr:magnesium and cobalt transport protein CorA [Streptomyces xanthophaeus]WST64587.1 magnesium and cobalt transport protein CorA [Streptomyces xanthophaeus]
MECMVYEERSGSSESVECGLDDEACRRLLKRLGGLAEGEFGWVRLIDPAEDELVQLAEELGLHVLAVEDAVNARQRPKAERFGDVLAVALKTLWYVEEDEAVETGEVMLFVGPRYVLTVRHGQVDPCAEAARQLDADPDKLRFGPWAVLHAVLDVVVDAYGEAAAKVRAALNRLEDQVFSTSRVDHTEGIYSLKREVREFRDAVQPLVPVLQGLLGGPGDGRHPPKALPYFRDVADHLHRTDIEVRTLDELLNSVLDAQQARVGTWQNDDMRRISAWAAIFAIPTMVAGVYGMNFAHMPELGWTYGYPLALGLMALASGLLHRAFRRNGWL